MVEQARLEELESGLAPAGDGWFAVNVRDAAWTTNDAFGAECVFEANRPVLRRRPERPVQHFPQLGFALTVIQPGQASGMYHGESQQEDFLVLAGECVAVVEGEERRLRAWDFVHCPPWTEHVFVGAGDGPCVIFMTGARTGDRRSCIRARRPRSATAQESSLRRRRRTRPTSASLTGNPNAPTPTSGRACPGRS
jgi:uncharacterized cupin superfamily protein